MVRSVRFLAYPARRRRAVQALFELAYVVQLYETGWYLGPMVTPK